MAAFLQYCPDFASYWTTICCGWSFYRKFDISPRDFFINSSVFDHLYPLPRASPRPQYVVVWSILSTTMPQSNHNNTLKERRDHPLLTPFGNIIKLNNLMFLPDQTI